MQTPEAQEVRETIAQKWYTLASGGEIERGDIFFRFVAVWIAFNALYASLHSHEEGDWNQVRSFAGEPEAIDRHRDLLKMDTEYRDKVEVLKHRGVYDPISGKRRKIRKERNLTEVASCLYQVRCNLFHGEKMPENPRDKNLVDASYIIVSKLIEPYLKGGQTH